MGNENLFTGKSGMYHEGRPSYPEGVFNDLSNLNAKTVLDIGAGSGIFTKQLLEHGIGEKIIASEPNDEMRMLLKQLLDNQEKLQVLPSSAESIELADSSVDLIVAAQSFHWFDHEAFQREAKRVLRKNGWVSLVWNKRAEHSQLHQELLQIEEEVGKKVNHSVPINSVQNFFNASFIRKQYRHNLSYTKETFLKRHFSSSYAPTRESEEGKEMEATLLTVFEKYEVDGEILIPMVTQHYYGQVK